MFVSLLQICYSSLEPPPLDQKRLYHALDAADENIVCIEVATKAFSNQCKQKKVDIKQTKNRANCLDSKVKRDKIYKKLGELKSFMKDYNGMVENVSVKLVKEAESQKEAMKDIEIKFNATHNK